LSAPLPHDERLWFGHPRGLATLYFTELWERFSYYGMRAILLFFLIAPRESGGLGMDVRSAGLLFGSYGMSAFLFAIIGGFVGDRFLGARRAVKLAAFVIAAGHFTLALPSRATFFVGLVLVAVGSGLLKPNISTLVGSLYAAHDPRRDAGFSLFYMGINVGAFSGQLITGALGEKVGWHWGFGAAGVGMLFGLVVFWMTRRRTLQGIGVAPTRHPDPVVQARQERNVKLALGVGLALVALVFFLAATGAVTLDAQAIGQSLVNVTLAMVVLFFAFVLFAGKLSGDEKKRIGVIFVLFLFAIVFWGAFEQAPTSLNLFARDFTDRTIGGWEMPATWFQSINSLFVILLAPVAAAVWLALDRRNADLSSPGKFSIGLAFAAVGFFLMIFAANRVVASGGTVLVSPWWLVGSYFFQTVGELCLSPVGLSSMTKLSPRKYVGQMMGIWFTASALGNLIGGLVGGHVDPENLQQMPQLFSRTTLSLTIAAVVLALLAIPIRRMMHNVRDTSASAAA
jgi:POT family proton-dependent oligopeptide transporter